MKVKMTMARVLIDVIFIFLCLKGYEFGIAFFNKMFPFHYFFMNILYGVFGIAYVLLFFKIIKPLLVGFIKALTIYAVCNDCDSFSQSAKGVVSKFGGTVAVITFNKLIREVIQEIDEHLDSGDFASEFYESIKGSLLSKSVDFVKHVAKRTFDYVDECVLGYIYTHDEGIGSAAATAVVAFIKNTGDIALKVVSVYLGEKIVITVYSILFILAVIQYGTFSFAFIVQYYILYFCIKYVIEDAIIEPFLCTVIVKHFCLSVQEAESNGKDDESVKDANESDGATSMDELNNFVSGFIPNEEVSELSKQILSLQKVINYKGKG